MIKSTTAMSKVCVKVDDSEAGLPQRHQVNYKGAIHRHGPLALDGHPGRQRIEHADGGPGPLVAEQTPASSPSPTAGCRAAPAPASPRHLNGFTATFKTRAAGNVNLSASWTVITADVDVRLADVDGPQAVPVDEKQFKAAQNLGTSGYSFAWAAASSTGSTSRISPQTASGRIFRR